MNTFLWTKSEKKRPSCAVSRKPSIFHPNRRCSIWEKNLANFDSREKSQWKKTHLRIFWKLSVVFPVLRADCYFTTKVNLKFLFSESFTVFFYLQMTPWGEENLNSRRMAFIKYELKLDAVKFNEISWRIEQVPKKHEENVFRLCRLVFDKFCHRLILESRSPRGELKYYNLLKKKIWRIQSTILGRRTEIFYIVEFFFSFTRAL